METILDLRLETPLIVDFVDHDWPLRPHKVLLLWRWWAKALVAGTLFDYKMLHGTEHKNAVKMPTQEETECVLQIVEKEMGLRLNSCFQIRFEEIEFGPPREVTPSFALQYGIRTLQRDEKLWHIDRGSATLVVVEECPLDKKAIEATMGALALAVRLSCFDRRGLGCFYVRAYGRYKELFEEEPEALIKRVAATVGTVVNRAVSRCRGLRHGEKTSPCGLPPAPALSVAHRYDACVKDLSPYILISLKRVRQEDLYGFWQKTRSYAYTDKKEALKTWIIGGIPERPSPLMLKISGNTAYLNVFVSADWPRELELEGRKIQIREADILIATAHVLAEFTDYVEKLGGEAAVIWPKPKGGI
jgi:CRISPR-associated protein Cmr1